MAKSRNRNVLKTCPTGKILNPLSGKCVLEEGRVGQRVSVLKQRVKGNVSKMTAESKKELNELQNLALHKLEKLAHHPTPKEKLSFLRWFRWKRKSSSPAAKKTLGRIVYVFSVAILLAVAGLSAPRIANLLHVTAESIARVLSAVPKTIQNTVDIPTRLVGTATQRSGRAIITFGALASAAVTHSAKAAAYVRLNPRDIFTTLEQAHVDYNPQKLKDKKVAYDEFVFVWTRVLAGVRNALQNINQQNSNGTNKLASWKSWIEHVLAKSAKYAE